MLTANAIGRQIDQIAFMQESVAWHHTTSNITSLRNHLMKRLFTRRMPHEDDRKHNRKKTAQPHSMLHTREMTTLADTVFGGIHLLTEGCKFWRRKSCHYAHYAQQLHSFLAVSTSSISNFHDKAHLAYEIGSPIPSSIWPWWWVDSKVFWPQLPNEINLSFSTSISNVLWLLSSALDRKMAKAHLLTPLACSAACFRQTFLSQSRIRGFPETFRGK